MKSLLKTTSPIHLVDPCNGQEIHWNRPTVVVHTSFIDSRMSAGDLKLINAEVPDEATDEDFLKFWKDSERDEELAVASFVSSFQEQEKEVAEPKAPVAPAPAPVAHAPKGK